MGGDVTGISLHSSTLQQINYWKNKHFRRFHSYFFVNAFLIFNERSLDFHYKKWMLNLCFKSQRKSRLLKLCASLPLKDMILFNCFPPFRHCRFLQLKKYFVAMGTQSHPSTVHVCSCRLLKTYSEAVVLQLYLLPR